MISWFGSKNILTQTLTGFAITCALFAAVSLYINYLNTMTVKDIGATHREVIPHTLNFIEIKRDIEQVQSWLTDISATRAAEGYDDGFTEAENYFIDLNKRIDHALQEHKKYGEDKTVALLTRFKTSAAAYYAMGKNMAQVYIEGGPEKGNPMMKEFDPYTVEVASIMDELVKEHLA